MDKTTKRYKFWKAIEYIVIVALIFGVGYTAGFNTATGGFSLGLLPSTSVSPPNDITRATLAEVEQALEPLRDMEYGQGWNCLDYAWEAMRRLHWQGQLAMIVQLDLEPDPNHAVLIVPTSDEGYVFIEPQTGKQIYPTIGGKYIDFTTIEGIYLMGITWTSFEEYLTDIDEGVVDTSGLSYYRVND